MAVPSLPSVVWMCWWRVGKADAVVTYGVSAQMRAREFGVKLNELRPRDYGVQFCGDLLDALMVN